VTIVLGFHGCDSEVASSLVSGKSFFEPSANVYDWLGAGVYFFENSPQRATKFAKFAAENPSLKTTKRPIKDPYIVGAVIELGLCLDLTTSEFMGEIRDCFEEINKHGPPELQKLKNLTNKASLNQEIEAERWNRPLDRSVLNYLHLRRERNGSPPFDTVRGAFQQGQPVFPGACIQEGTHIQIAVRNPNSILGIFAPMEPKLASLWKSALEDPDFNHYEKTDLAAKKHK